MPVRPKNTVTGGVNNTIDLSVKTFIDTNHTLSKYVRGSYCCLEKVYFDTV